VLIELQYTRHIFEAIRFLKTGTEIVLFSQKLENTVRSLVSVHEDSFILFLFLPSYFRFFLFDFYSFLSLYLHFFILPFTFQSLLLILFLSCLFLSFISTFHFLSSVVFSFCFCLPASF
jgi:hypothetical protein